MNFKGVSDNDKLRDAEKAANYTAWLRDAMMQSGITIGQKLHDNITQEVKKTTETCIDIKLAIAVLKDNMQADSELAWGWHCNIAVHFMDEGVEHEAANKGAARVMQNIFGIDMTQHELFKGLVTGRYTPVVKDQITMDFGTAIEALKNGKTVARKGWKNSHRIYETNGSVLMSDHLACNVQSWTAWSEDMLAEDWIIVE